jgi:hypothetical protein
LGPTHHRFAAGGAGFAGGIAGAAVAAGDSASKGFAHGTTLLSDGRLAATPANAFLVRHGLFDPFSLIIAQQGDTVPSAEESVFHVTVTLQPRLVPSWQPTPNQLHRE